MVPEPIVHVIDDDESIREALTWLLGTVKIKAIAYPDAQQFLQSLPGDQPGCLLLDVRMSGLGGVELQRRLNEIGCDLPVIFLTGHADVSLAVRAMKAGAFDFLEKPFNNENLLDIVRAALAESLIRHQARAAARRAEAATQGLTSRETDVLRLLVAGRTNKQIAEELKISAKTVEFHRSNIMKKTSSKFLSDLVDKTAQLFSRKP
jgi:FixJ family two-component response regulator